jgi:hypothetical protein
MPFRASSLGGHYEEEYARVGDQWRIASLRLSYLRLDTLPGRPVTRDDGASLVGDERPIQRLSTEQLVDAAAIERLKAESCRLLDTKNLAAWRALFTADARIDDVPVADAATGFERTYAQVPTVHQAHMPELAFDGDDSAHAIWSTFEFLADRESEDRATQDYGHSDEEYHREDGEWKIASINRSTIRRDRLTDEQVPRPLDWSRSAYD